MTLLHQAAQKAVEALQSAAAGLDWYRDMCPQFESPADAEMTEQMDAAVEALESALQQQPEPVAEDDPTHWKQNYFNLRHVMQDWHAQALTARFDGVPDVLLVAAEAANLFSALNAMLTQFGMDEDEWSRPTFKQAKSAIEQYLAARKKTADAPALQQQEVPREPTDAQIIEQMKNGGLLEGDGPSMTVAQWDRLFTLVRHFAASPSTTQQQEAPAYLSPEACKQFAEHATRQQEVGSVREQTLAGLLKRCARCLPPEHATRKLATEYLRENGYLSPLRAAAPSTPEKAGGVPDGVALPDGGQSHGA